MCPACLEVAGRARAERWKVSHSPSPATRDPRPPMPSSPIAAARSQYLLDLLAQVPDPSNRRGRRHSLPGLLAVGGLVIAIDGKTVRGAKNKAGKAPHLVAALAHGIGAVLGQVAVEAKSNE